MVPAHMEKFYIGGAWVEPKSAKSNGCGKSPRPRRSWRRWHWAITSMSMRRWPRARAAFPAWTVTPVRERIAVLKRVLDAYNEMYEEFAQVMSTEMGAPIEWGTGCASLGGAGPY